MATRRNVRLIYVANYAASHTVYAVHGGVGRRRACMTQTDSGLRLHAHAHAHVHVPLPGVMRVERTNEPNAERNEMECRAERECTVQSRCMRSGICVYEYCIRKCI